MSEDSLVDLGGFESFVYHAPADDCILRVTHTSHRQVEDILAEMAFVRHLANGGARVCEPRQLGNGELAWQIGEFVVSSFSFARGRRIQKEDWSPPLFRKWGKAIGQFHHLARGYDATYPRMQWDEDENLNFAARLPESESRILEIGEHLLDEVSRFEKSSDTYGLIHCDAHSGNFMLDGENLTFFDFDDCCYQWYAYDIATIIFGAVMQPWMADTKAAREKAAREFVPHFLEGYTEACELTPLVLNEMHRFLKLREISLYAVIHACFDVNNLTEWYPKKFMEGRKQSLEAKVPYLDLDFTLLF